MPVIENVRRDDDGVYHWTEDGADRTAPSVSNILKPLDDYSHIKPDVLEFAADRGTAIHKGTELYDKNELDFESVHDVIAVPLGNWILWRKRTGFEPLFIEQFVRSNIYRFAGRLDRIGLLPEQTINGRNLPDCILVLDIKSGEKLPVKLGPQTAGYRQASLETVQLPDQFADLPVLRGVFHADATNEHRWFDFLTDDEDWNVFLSCANIYHFKRRKA